MMTEKFMVDDAGTLIDMETRDTYDYVSDVVDLLNDQYSQIKSFKPIATESISVVNELNGKYQSALTSIGAFNEFLGELDRTFNWEFWTAEQVFELISEQFKRYCEYELEKVNQRR